MSFLIGYALLALFCFLISCVVEYQNQEYLTIGDVLVFGLISVAPIANIIFAGLAINQFVPFREIMNKKIFEKKVKP